MGKLPEFLENRLKEQYGEENFKQIMKGYSSDRKTTFRVNTLKSETSAMQAELESLGIEYGKTAWSEEAFILKNAREKEIQELDMYKNGEIYLQSLSSMLPPIILNPKPNTDILDMAAAPGGKTTQMAALTQNKAHITACEINSVRAERLKYNIEKQGASSVYVMVSDSRNMDEFFSFDNILLDAPCSGSGTLQIKDSNLEKKFTMKLIEKSTKTQLALLRKAMKMLKSGQEMIYSTCSILACENEDVVSQVLRENNAEIVPIELNGMEDLPRLPVKIEGTLCICPDELYEGFFVAKMRKR